jgi:hypothetical protein
MKFPVLCSKRHHSAVGKKALRARANYGDRVATVALLVGAIVGSARDRDPVDVGRVGAPCAR